jgi:hypothetical protein
MSYPTLDNDFIEPYQMNSNTFLPFHKSLFVLRKFINNAEQLTVYMYTFTLFARLDQMEELDKTGCTQVIHVQGT